MTEIRCDRCNTVIEEGEERQLTLNDGSHMEPVVDDLCPRCATAVRDFCRPIPAAANG